MHLTVDHVIKEVAEEDVDEEVTDTTPKGIIVQSLKVLVKKKVTMIMIKKNLKLMKDQEDHIGAEEVAVAVDIEVEADIVDVLEVEKAQEMKTQKTRDVMVTTKEPNLKNEEETETTDVHEDTEDDQDDHHHKAQVTKVIVIVGNKKNVVSEELKKGEVDVVEDVAAPTDLTVIANQRMLKVEKLQRLDQLRRQTMKLRQTPLQLQTKLRLHVHLKLSCVK